MVTHALQSSFPHLVFFLLLRLRMITSVYFYNQTSVARGEIGDIISYYVLAKEVLSTRFLISKVLP